MLMLNVQILKLMDVDRKNMGNNPDIKNCALDSKMCTLCVHIKSYRGFLQENNNDINYLVEMRGIEPLASALRTPRSPS